MATSVGGGKENTLPRLPSKLTWLGAGPRRGQAILLGYSRPCLLGLVWALWAHRDPPATLYIHHGGLCLQTGPTRLNLACEHVVFGLFEVSFFRFFFLNV